MVLMEIWDKTQVNSTRPYTEYLDRTYYRNSDFASSSTNVRKSIERQSNSSEFISIFYRFENKMNPFFFSSQSRKEH